MTGAAPLIGVTACARAGERHVFHSVAAQYVEAVVNGVGGVPIIVPALGARMDIPALLSRLDGLLLTGSPSNVEPHHYGGPASREGTLHDPARDATTLPLIRAALDVGMPLLAICRGNQELNVALGGTLHQHVHELPGKRDHRGRKVPSNEERYGYAHTIDLAPGGTLERLAGARTVTVNSLHAQAIDRVAGGLEVEATSTEDGVIEAVRVAAATSFAIGVQWHPEWHIATDILSRALFASFGDAARERAARRNPRARTVTAA
ncbi:MAG TPA: gamma-glutamyl-gamma-aminobutyrate hydrolase family protein [Alphaproteobacteria bacterium]|nr:gamma-glutamyl-gamma-aminobutyrate hydrolase family protein [Alphaproteobacteria bacterium]